MKTLLVGNFGAQNIGDELILLSALQAYPKAVVMTADAELSQTFCETTFKTVLFPPTAFRSFARYFTSKKYRKAVAALKNFDEIVFVGGGLFAIKLRACVLWFLVFRWLKHFNPTAEFRFENQGIDKQMSSLSRWFTKSALSKADFISVRDVPSLQALSALEINEITLTGDRVELAQLAWKKTSANTESILVNALAPLETKLLKRLEKKAQGKDLVFVAFQHSDLNFVPENWSGRFEFPQTKTELFNLFDKADLMVGERLHSLILATKILDPASVKLLRAPYSEKVTSFADKFGWKIF
ncbi:hypothetical protein GW756_04980 [bacterium]|nr:hypothetical protein [bacterium]NCQ55731.1 hypothetical protein [Candidatus Parcubacteria bacterium]NCS67680.1 hypothetical protein [Candidatus Peregrinibacteria bacterium]NCS96694.1 hypothetical protein [bacterium]